MVSGDLFFCQKVMVRQKSLMLTCRRARKSKILFIPATRYEFVIEGHKLSRAGCVDVPIANRKNKTSAKSSTEANVRQNVRP